jgi:hypothetical protein
VQDQKPVPEWMQDSLFAYSEEEEEGKVAAKAKRRPASKRKMPKVQLGKSPKKRGKVANFCFIFCFLYVFMIFIYLCGNRVLDKPACVSALDKSKCVSALDKPACVSALDV